MNITIPDNGGQQQPTSITPTPNTTVLRNATGQAQVAVPVVAADIARLDTVTATQVGLGNVTNESKAVMFTNPSFTGNVGVNTTVPTSTLDVRGDSNRFSNFSGMKEFSVLTENGFANQKIDLFMTGSQAFSGTIVIEITGGHSHVQASGFITFINSIELFSNSIHTNFSNYINAQGNCPNIISISPIRWDNINSRAIITIANRTSLAILLNINLYYYASFIESANNAATFTMGPVYTTDPTVFPRPEVSFQHRVGIGITEPTTQLDISGNGMRIRTPRTPASATAPGNVGDICWDAGFVYVCTATNTWRRSALTAW